MQAFSPAPLELADMHERLAELAAKAAAVPSWAAYAEPAAAAAATTPRKAAGACRAEALELCGMSERLAELAAATSA